MARIKGSGFKMNGFSGFKSSPKKHAKSAGGHSKIYGEHTNADHPNYWKGSKGSKTERKERVKDQIKKAIQI